MGERSEKRPEGIASAGELVTHAIDDALILHPPPAVPAEANTHATAALKTIQTAKTKADLAAARLEYQSALALAPWWADAWFNLAALDEQLEAYGDARFALETYLRAAPDAPDKDRIQKKIDELQSKAKSS
jgi:tetratricopeptide (TPR) repeat protein